VTFPSCEAEDVRVLNAPRPTTREPSIFDDRRLNCELGAFRAHALSAWPPAAARFDLPAATAGTRVVGVAEPGCAPVDPLCHPG
jgi:hypothetical protein